MAECTARLYNELELNALSVDSQLFSLSDRRKLCPVLFLRSVAGVFICFIVLSVVMATYAAYRHIELDKVGYSKKRVRNPSSEILNVICTPPSPEKANGHHTSRRSSQHGDSFNRLFGSPEFKKTPPRRGSLTNQDVTNRNPVTGNGVTSWDCRPLSRNNSPRIHTERNPITGETYTIVSPATTPTKPVQNGFAPGSATSTPIQNGNPAPQKSAISTPNGNA